MTLTILETAPNVWTSYDTMREAAEAHGVARQNVFDYLERHGTGAGWYARQAGRQPIACMGFPSRSAAARALGMHYMDLQRMIGVRR